MLSSILEGARIKDRLTQSSCSTVVVSCCSCIDCLLSGELFGNLLVPRSGRVVTWVTISSEHILVKNKPCFKLVRRLGFVGSDGNDQRLITFESQLARP